MWNFVWQSWIFWGKFFCSKIRVNGPKIGQKQVFKIYWKIWLLIFSLNLFCNENLYYLLCSCTNPILGKIFVLEIWAKMFSAKQIAGFFNQPYLQNKSIKYLDFLHVGTRLHELKVDLKFSARTWLKNGSGQSGHGTLKLTVSQKWIDGMNWYFACCSKFRKAKIYFNEFWVGMVRNGSGHSAHETLKSAVSKEWVYEFSWFFACWLWGSNFWLNRHHTLYLWLLNLSLLQLYLLDL